MPFKHEEVQPAPANKKAGEISLLSDLVISKLSALESNLGQLFKGISPILTPPPPSQPTADSMVKTLAPLGQFLGEVVNRLDIMIDSVASTVERNQL